MSSHPNISRGVKILAGRRGKKNHRTLPQKPIVCVSGRNGSMLTAMIKYVRCFTDINLQTADQKFKVLIHKHPSAHWYTDLRHN